MEPSSSEELAMPLRALLRDHVESFEKIEILAAAHRDPETALEGRRISADLRISQDLIQIALEQLCDRRILVRDGAGYRLRPSPELAARVEALCRAYETDRLLVLNVMTQLSFERIRGATSAFADAFRLRTAGKRKEK